MGTRKRQTQTAIARRRHDVAERYCRGETIYTIAEAVGVHPSTVSRDLGTIHQEWVQSAVRDFDRARAIELSKIDYLERRYWEAWERSRQDAETRTTEQSGDDVKRRRQRTGQSGNPAFLAGVQWCINKRCELLGLDPPKRSELSVEAKPGQRAEQYHDDNLLRFLPGPARQAENDQHGG